MENAFAWLKEIFDKLLLFLPKRAIVRSTHSGVAFVRGKPRVLKPQGIFIYWPFWTEVEIVPIVRQTADLSSQIIMAKHGSEQVAVSASGVVVYHLADPVKTLTSIDAYTEAINDLGRAAVKDVIFGRDMACIGNQLDIELADAVRAKLRRYGITVQSACLTDFAISTPLHLFGGVEQWGNNNTPQNGGA